MSDIPSESLPESPLNTPPAAPLAVGATSSQDAAVKSKPSLLATAFRYSWILASYFIPYLITYLFFAVRNQEDCLIRAGKVGMIGLVSAGLIFVIWTLDSRFGAKQIFSQSRDPLAKTMVCLLMLALWVSWLSVGIAMNMSFDQVNAPTIPVMRGP